MSKYNEHITDEMSELIALEMMLGDDMDSQNLLDMEAQFAYSQPMEATINIDKEIELISRLQKTVKPSFWTAFIKYFIGISIVIYGVSLFINRHGNSNNLLPQNNNNHSEKLATVAGKPKDTSNTETKKTHNWLANKKEEKQHIADSVEKVKVENKSEQYTTSSGGAPMPALKMPKHKAQEADYLPAAPPSFGYKYNVKEYKKAKANFDLVFSNYNEIAINQNKAELTYFIGKPIKKDPADLLYINYGEYIQRELENQKNIIKDTSIKLTASAKSSVNQINNFTKLVVPYSTRLYIDSSKVKIDSNRLVFKELNREILEKCIQPFYFKTREVENYEYSQFVNWVREANGYNSKVEANNNFEKAYTYTFFNLNNQVRLNIPTNTINIYPDTACWTKDFTKSFCEPMTKTYSSHPAYSTYPVVGVNYWQALAFLDWKTHFHQLELNKAGIKYEVEYTLPSDIDWEIASITCKVKDNINFSGVNAQDTDWLTDLLLARNGKNKNTDEFHNYLRKFINRNTTYIGNFATDGFLYTSNMIYLFAPNSRMHVSANDAWWMDSNVSEWMQENYKDNWKPIFTKHIQLMEKQKGVDAALVKSIEQYYDAYNAPNGQLVRGCNWFDERFSCKAIGEDFRKSANVAGTNVKRFVDPNEQHSTLGFRYVVKFKIVE